MPRFEKLTTGGWLWLDPVRRDDGSTTAHGQTMSETAARKLRDELNEALGEAPARPPFDKWMD